MQLSNSTTHGAESTNKTSRPKSSQDSHLQSHRHGFERHGAGMNVQHTQSYQPQPQHAASSLLTTSKLRSTNRPLVTTQYAQINANPLSNAREYMSKSPVPMLSPLGLQSKKRLDILHSDMLDRLARIGFVT